MQAGYTRSGASSTTRRHAVLLLALRQHSTAWLVTNFASFVFFEGGAALAELSLLSISYL